MTVKEIISSIGLKMNTTVSDKDYYGGSLLTDPVAIKKYLADGGQYEIPKYTASIARTVKVTDPDLIKYNGMQPKYIRSFNSKFNYIQDQHYTDDTALTLLIKAQITLSASLVIDTIEPSLIPREYLPVYSSRPKVGSDEFYSFYGDYYYRMLILDTLESYKKVVYNQILPQILNQEQIDIYKQFIRISYCGTYTSYGNNRPLKTTDDKYISMVHIETGNPKYDYNINSGAFRGIAILHEWWLGHSMVLPLQLYYKLNNKSGNLSRLRQYLPYGIHNEGFTNTIEYSGIKWGQYNKATYDSQGYFVLGTEIDYELVLSILISSSRTGIRLCTCIGMHSSKINDSNGTYKDPITGIISKGSYNLARATNEFSSASGLLYEKALNFTSRNINRYTQNCNYAPAALLIFGCEKNYKKLLGSKWNYNKFFTAAVIDAVQPATINGMYASLEKWYLQQ